MSDELPQLSYSLPSAAKALDISIQGVRNEIRDGRIVPVYFGTKPLIPLTEARRWLDSLPTERRAS